MHVYRKCVCHQLSITTCVFVSLSILILIGVLVFLFYYTKNGFTPTQQSVTYGPGDTQPLFFHPLFTERLSPKTDTLYSDDYEQSSLYLLDEEPSLTGKANITFQDALDVDEIHQRNFHFYPSSVISFEVCVENNVYSSFYLVQGQSAYTEWVESSESSDPPYVKSLKVSESCNQRNQTFAYTVVEEDQYYLLFVNNNNNNKYANSKSSQIVVSYNLQRTVYEFGSNATKGSCSFTASPCSVHVPFQLRAVGLLVYGTPTNWEESWENKRIGINYAPRFWVYALFGGSGLVVITAAILCLCAVCCCCRCCLKKQTDDAHRPLLGHHTANLLDQRPRSEELNNPSGDVPRVPQSHGIFSQSPSLYRPPSFKDASGKFSLGPPTSGTFIGKD